MAQPDTICDFCSTPLYGSKKSYRANMRAIIPLDDGVLEDDGEWLACDVCAGLKDGNKWEELLVRCVNSLMLVNNIPESERQRTRRDVYAIWEKAFSLKDEVKV